MRSIKYILILLFLTSNARLAGQTKQDVIELLEKRNLEFPRSGDIQDLKNVIENSNNSADDSFSEPNFDDKSKDLILDFDSNQSTVNDINTSESPSDNLNDVNNDEIEEQEEFLASGDIFKNNLIDRLPYFGYNIFDTNPDIFQNSDEITVDGGYIVNPGDEIILMLWGDTEINRSYTVSKDGYLFIENLGQIFVNGLTLDKLENKLLNQLKKVYSSLDSSNKNASTFFDLSLGSSVRKNKRVFALGEVDKPGAYNIKRSATLFSSLYYFNGPKTNGSLRDVVLYRNEKKIGSIDFYDFLLGGKKTDDIALLEDDVVFFPIRINSISIDGEIARPAVYELKAGEGLKDLIEIAGGILNTSYLERLKILRIQPHDERHLTGIDRLIIDVNLKELFNSDDDFDLYDGDEILIYKISDFISNQVKISGAVQRPGEYEYESGMNLSVLIDKADGLLGSAYLRRANLIRINPDGSETFKSIDLESIINENSEDFSLLPNDEINIFSNSDLLYETDLSILGHVSSPGVKKFRHGTTLLDLIHQGGGFANEEHLKNTYFDKAYLSSWDPNEFKRKYKYFRLDSVLSGNGIAKMELKMGDEVRIFSRSEIKGLIDNQVSILGNVKNPGSYDLADNMTLRDLLFLAGGFDDDIFSLNIYFPRAHLIRSSGSPNDKKLYKLDLKKVMDDKDSKFLLQPGDQISVFSTANYTDIGRVIISGAVAQPGEYDLIDGLTLNDLILEAGNFLPTAKSVNVEIARLNSIENKKIDFFNFELKNNIEVLDSVFRNKKSFKKFKLIDGDIVSVRPSYTSYDYSFVEIQGEVSMPGRYVISEGDEKITDLINRAGGVTDFANLDASAFIRNQDQVNISLLKIIKYPRSQQNFYLADGDQIQIGKKTGEGI